MDEFGLETICYLEFKEGDGESSGLTKGWQIFFLYSERSHCRASSSVVGSSYYLYTIIGKI